MKVALLAAAASLLLAFAAHAADLPAAGRTPLPSCDGMTMIHRMSYMLVADQIDSPALCPKFLSTLLMKLPRREQRT